MLGFSIPAESQGVDVKQVTRDHDLSCGFSAFGAYRTCNAQYVDPEGTKYLSSKVTVHGGGHNVSRSKGITSLRLYGTDQILRAHITIYYSDLL